MVVEILQNAKYILSCLYSRCEILAWSTAIVINICFSNGIAELQLPIAHADRFVYQRDIGEKTDSSSLLVTRHGDLVRR
jgi:hypothetical protein